MNPHKKVVQKCKFNTCVQLKALLSIKMDLVPLHQTENKKLEDHQTENNNLKFEVAYVWLPRMKIDKTLKEEVNKMMQDSFYRDYELHQEIIQKHNCYCYYSHSVLCM